MQVSFDLDKGSNNTPILNLSELTCNISLQLIFIKKMCIFDVQSSSQVKKKA